MWPWGWCVYVAFYSCLHGPCCHRPADGVVGVFRAVAAFLPRVFFSTKWRTCSTVSLLVISSSRSCWISWSATPMHSWSETLLSLQSTWWLQWGQVSMKSQVLATPLNREAKDRQDSPLSWVIRAMANVATRQLSCITAMALMAASSSSSPISSIGVGPLVVLVRSFLSPGSRHSSSCIPRSAPASLDARE